MVVRGTTQEQQCLLARPWPGVQTRFESTCVLPLAVIAAVTVAVASAVVVVAAVAAVVVAAYRS